MQSLTAIARAVLFRGKRILFIAVLGLPFSGCSDESSPDANASTAIERSGFSIVTAATGDTVATTNERLRGSALVYGSFANQYLDVQFGLVPSSTSGPATICFSYHALSEANVANKVPVNCTPPIDVQIEPQVPWIGSTNLGCRPNSLSTCQVLHVWKIVGNGNYNQYRDLTPDGIPIQSKTSSTLPTLAYPFTAGNIIRDAKYQSVLPRAGLAQSHNSTAAYGALHVYVDPNSPKMRYGVMIDGHFMRSPISKSIGLAVATPDAAGILKFEIEGLREGYFSIQLTQEPASGANVFQALTTVRPYSETAYFSIFHRYSGNIGCSLMAGQSLGCKAFAGVSSVEFGKCSNALNTTATSCLIVAPSGPKADFSTYSISSLDAKSYNTVDFAKTCSDFFGDVVCSANIVSANSSLWPTSFVDEFNRADAPSLGSAWKQLVGAFKVSSNVATTTAPGYALAVIPKSIGDFDIQGKYTAIGPTDSTPSLGLGLVGRYAGPADTSMYYAKVTSTGKNATVMLYKNSKDKTGKVVWTLLATSTATNLPTSGTMRFAGLGSKLIVSINGVVVASAQDSELARGYAGMWGSFGSTMDSIVVRARP